MWQEVVADNSVFWTSINHASQEAEGHPFPLGSRLVARFSHLLFLPALNLGLSMVPIWTSVSLLTRGSIHRSYVNQCQGEVPLACSLHSSEDKELEKTWTSCRAPIITFLVGPAPRSSLSQQNQCSMRGLKVLVAVGVLGWGRIGASVHFGKCFTHASKTLKVIAMST